MYLKAYLLKIIKYNFAARLLMLIHILAQWRNALADLWQRIEKNQ